jgi:hypothetical protein
MLYLRYEYEDGQEVRQPIFGEHTHGLLNAVSLLESQQPMKKKIDILKNPQKNVISPKNMKDACSFLLEIFSEQRQKTE